MKKFSLLICLLSLCLSSLSQAEEITLKYLAENPTLTDLNSLKKKLNLASQRGVWGYMGGKYAYEITKGKDDVRLTICSGVDRSAEDSQTIVFSKSLKTDSPQIAHFKINLAGKEIAVPMAVFVGGKAYGDYYRTTIAPMWTMAGKYKGQPIYIINYNFTSSGYNTDGQCGYAYGAHPKKFQPLGETISIGGDILKVKISADGTKLNLVAYPKDKLAEVSFAQPLTKGDFIVLRSQTSGRFRLNPGSTKIPAGEYYIFKGSINKYLLMEYYNRNLTLIIKPGVKNIINLGSPMSLRFVASLNKDTVTVGSEFKIIGQAGAEYNRGDIKGNRVTLEIYEGNKKLATGTSGFG